ncbi:type II secretion system F family protein [Granulosicoccaceae sp. 1_MG-2023]|nr:type II secretion system F family protein [Granulosicoccaceae sp. 1_MG-2023]
MIDHVGSDRLLFLGLTFAAIVILAIWVIVPAVGPDGRASRNIRRRLRAASDKQELEVQSLLREQYLEELSPFERRLEGMPGMARLRQLLEQAGRRSRAYRLVMQAVSLAVVSVLGLSLLGLRPLWVAGGGMLALLAPLWLVKLQRDKRIRQFEEQLPVALDSISRALQAGHPFSETLKLIGEEMPGPVGEEFSRVFNDINYGVPAKSAYLAMLERVPSVSLNALVTAILIQQENGGRMSEILDKIAHVIRARFQLERRVKSLSAEGRISAWVLIMLPFGLALLMSVKDPTYIPALIEDPKGFEWVSKAGVLMIVGILWIRKLINIRV